MKTTSTTIGNETMAVANPNEISGTLQTWKYRDQKARNYIEVPTNYGRIRNIAKAVIYDIEKQTGEQRNEQKGQIKILKHAVKTGEFVPTPIFASVTDDSLVRYDGKRAFVNIENITLALTDGLQRNTCLEELRIEDGDTKHVDKLPITIRVYLEPEERKKDFLRLNKGKPIDVSHILNLEIDAGISAGDPETSKQAKSLAGKLHKNSKSHLNNQVNLSGGGSAPIKLSMIATAHKTEQPQTLYGSAMIAKQFEKDEDWIVLRLIQLWQILSSKTPDLVKAGGALCPPPESRQKSVAKLIIGMSNLFMYRLFLLGQDVPTDEDIDIFVSSANKVFSSATKSPSAPQQRDALGRFGGLLMMDLHGNPNIVTGFHDALPISLLQLFSGPSYGVTKLDKAPKVAKTPKVAEVVEEVAEDFGELEDQKEYPDSMLEFDATETQDEVLRAQKAFEKMNAEEDEDTINF